MPNSNKPAPSLIPQIGSPSQQALSQLQQQFNQKVEQINQLKQEIELRKTSIQRAQQRIEKELRPIIEKQLEKRVELVKLLDEAYAFAFFSFREKEKLAWLIADITYELISKYERQDMLAYHDKYSELSYEERSTAKVQHDNTAFDETIPEGEPENLAEIDDSDDYEHLQAKLDREREQREQEKQHRQRSRKTKAQLAKEAIAKAELQNISKACRRIYTDLAKQLHPDKELDATKRAWKEEAMKRVTQAYHQDDFFELLGLQMEFLQEQGQALDKLPDEHLQYYVQLLTDQVNDLKTELNLFSIGPDAIFYKQFCGSPGQMDKKFKAAKEDLNLELEQLKQNIRTLKDDPQMIKVILK